jgi:mannose-6-phosphate isomerase-like protein (cupin superfamily)
MASARIRAIASLISIKSSWESLLLTVLKQATIVNMNEVESYVLDQNITPLRHITVRSEDTRLRRLITNKRCGSQKVMLGVLFMDPSDKAFGWFSKDEDEPWFIVRGEISIKADGEEVFAKAGDAVMFWAGQEYQVKNTGVEPVFVVYATSPPLE